METFHKSYSGFFNDKLTKLHWKENVFVLFCDDFFHNFSKFLLFIDFSLKKAIINSFEYVFAIGDILL